MRTSFLLTLLLLSAKIAVCQEVGNEDRLPVPIVGFKLGTTEMLPGSDTTLAQTLSLLRRYPNTKLQIRGYCRETGDSLATARLSGSRAAVVRAWLIEHGANAAFVTSTGYGATGLLTTKPRRLQRLGDDRVEIIVVAR